MESDISLRRSFPIPLLTVALALAGCETLPTAKVGEKVTGTITQDSKQHFSKDSSGQVIDHFYFEAYNLTVEAGRTYTVERWADTSLQFEDNTDSGEFRVGNITAPSGFGNPNGGSATASWTLKRGGTIRVDVYSRTVPAKFSFTVR